MRVKQPIYVLLMTLLLADLANAAPATYYRYKDAEGNLIISNTIEAENALLGYEIINARGRLIKKVDPPPSNEQQQEVINKKKAAAAQKDYDLALMRKYSFVGDIEAEKKRKMAELQATLSIVKGNLTGIRAELEELYATAASIEREGKPIPAPLTKKIKDVESAVISTETLYQLRQSEMEKSSLDYNVAIKRFQEIQELRGKK